MEEILDRLESAQRAYLEKMPGYEAGSFLVEDRSFNSTRRHCFVRSRAVVNGRPYFDLVRKAV